MKTTDLIPIILYQLIDGDKYGYEIVKQIEDYSNGRIVIKQPTLYSVLKKLEQGRFISSYWQDSEIGGKRHYYKLTDNGRAQLSTYPSFATLINDILEEDNLSITPTPEPTTPPQQANDTYITNDNAVDISISHDKDEEIDELVPTPIDLTISTNSDIKTEEESLYTELTNNTYTKNNDSPISNIEYNNITVDVEPDVNPDLPSSFTSIFDAIDFSDNSSDVELNTNEDDSNINNEQPTPDNNLNAMFTEKVEPVQELTTNDSELYNILTPSQDLITEVENNTFNSDPDISSINQIEEIKFLNYTDFKTDKTSLKRKQAISKHIQKMTITCLTLLIMFVVSCMVCNKYSFSKLWYVCAIVVCLFLILYPIILITNIPKIRYKYCSKMFKYSISRDFFVKLSIFLSIVIAIFAYNLSIATTIKSIFVLSNFANFYSPILFATTILLDLLYSIALYKRYTK